MQGQFGLESKRGGHLAGTELLCRAAASPASLSPWAGSPSPRVPAPHGHSPHAHAACLLLRNRGRVHAVAVGGSL